ncbi:MAG: hypothetical protein NVSMB13_03740 [Mycobacteriales bacterium]
MSSTLTQPAPAATQLTHKQILVVFSGLMLGMFLAALDQTIVATALPTIVGELHGLNHLSWVVTAYLLTSTASTPLYGKISDIYGRKIVFQFAIALFIVGSVLAGFSSSMNELIAFRAVQGLGGGGLLTLALAIVGDVVSPRERGRYQGYFGAVFGVSSVAGPLLGGFFTEGPGWPWIFFINVPLGLIALAVTTTVLKLPVHRTEHTIDYVGAALLVAGVSALLLVTVWGGTQYAWGSGTILGLAVAGLVLIGVFLFWESRVPEPILPLRLFRIRTFSVGVAVSAIVGCGMFGAIIFLPLYMQVVKGATPTASGLYLLPLMVGVLGTSITSGRIISKIGRYRPFPIAGTAVMAFGFYLLTHLGLHTSQWLISAYIFVIGVGLGGVMQVLVLALQNSVGYRDLGVATSSASFFRSLGGAFGTSVFGAVLSSRLAHYLPAGQARGATSVSPRTIHLLPPQVQGVVLDGFVKALHSVFWVAVPVAALAFLLTLLLEDVQLRETSGLAGQEAAAGVPGGGAALEALGSNQERQPAS